MKHERALPRYHARATGYADLGDLFLIDPIRRSLVMILAGLTALIVPLVTGHGELQAIALIVTTWFGVTSVVIGLPILILSLIEEGWCRYQRWRWPAIDQLDLSPRARNLLRRHGFLTIASVEQASDATLLLLSNLDARTVREIRRGISLWQYRCWQEGGFR